MGAVVVHDEVHFLIRREFGFQMVEEPDELPAAVAILTGANYLAIENVERGEKGRCSMAFVVVCLALWQARPQRENRGSPIQSLNLALLIYTQHQSALGRVQIQTNNIPDLLFEARIVGQFETLYPMWLNIVPFPDAMNNRPRHPEPVRQHSYAPVRTAVAGSGLDCGIDDFLFQFGRQNPACALSPSNAGDGRQSALRKSIAQRQNSGPRNAELLRDRLIRNAVVCKKKQSTPKRYLLWRVATSRQTFQF